MRTLTDSADDLLARTDDLEIHTQNTMQLDSAPDFHGSSEDEENLFAGLAGKAPKRVKMPKQAGVQQVRPGSQRPQTVSRPAQRQMRGFMPGMGDLSGAPRRQVVRRPQQRQMRGFMPGMGDLSGAPKGKRVVRRQAPPRPSAGFMPGMGDFTVAGMGIGTLALIGVGAWLVLRRKRA
jgi:hypothetical protein